MPHRETEIAVERVNQNFKSRLQGGEVDLVFPGFRLPGQILGLDPEIAQIPKEFGKNTELVLLGKIVVNEHDGGIKGGDVAVEHPSGGALIFHVGEAAGHLLAFVRPGDRSAPKQVLAEEKGIDLGGVPAQRDVLVTVGEDLGFDEIAG